MAATRTVENESYRPGAAANASGPLLCCLLWARPGQEEALSKYEDLVLAIAEEHGCEVIQRAVSNEDDGPREVQLLRFDSTSMEAFLADPRREAMAGTRGYAVARTQTFPVHMRPAGR